MTDRFERFEGHDGRVELAFHCPGCNFPHSFQIAGDGSNWTWNGDLDRATFSPSLLVRFGDRPGDKRCHSFVREGRIQFLTDCTHALAGKTVDIPTTEAS